MNILCIDIDDCIWPSNYTWLGETDDSLDILAINLTRIKMIIEKFDVKIFITSSWSTILSLKDNNISLTLEDYFEEETNVFNLISEALNGNIVGISSGNRIRDIKKLLNENNRVIAIDDMNLSEISHGNYLYLEVIGYISNRDGYKIKEFFEKE